MAIKTTLRCAFCTETFQIIGRMDDDMNGVTTCPHCDISISTIMFEFVEEEEC